MFWTAFVWGLGVSCGATVGLLAFVVSFWVLQWASGRAAEIEAAKKVAELSLVALDRRNELTEETIEHLRVIAVAARTLQQSREI